MGSFKFKNQFLDLFTFGFILTYIQINVYMNFPHYCEN